MQHIAILDMGGTINGILDPDDAPPSHSLVIDYVAAKAESFGIHIRGQQIVMKDSRAVTDADRDALLGAIRRSEEDALLVPHGTFTLATTGEYIAHALQAEPTAGASQKRIVLVGARYPLGAEDSDAPHRLKFAINALLTAEPGVWVAMEDKLWRPHTVTKDLDSGRFVPR
ncbi:MAG: asparaginase domain-containing protein [Pseudomonadota bacterium]